MSKYSQLRPEFFHSLASGQLSERVQQHVPQSLVERWTERFYRAERPSCVPERPRLLNHFKMGADPEFAFLTGAGGKQLSASDYKLKAGLCFGADNNGRLVELRPRASHYLVEVLASILSELRWLAAMHPQTLSVCWKAGAYSGQDGLGGHVHFGRKRNSILKVEVQALDKINSLLHCAGVFSPEEHQLRLTKNYGKSSDWRPQVHGYEFRSFPSWMNSPWIAYLTMTLAKLAVLDPATVNAIQVVKGIPSFARKSIRNLLAYVKALDDDALLAFCALDVWGLPAFGDQAADFKNAWGIYPLPLAEKPTIELLPLSVAPSKQDIEEVFLYLLQGRPLYNSRPSEALWPFKNAPKGFVALQTTIDTHLCPGLMELLWDLVLPKGVNLHFGFDTESHDKHHKQPAVFAAPGIVQWIGSTALHALPFYKGQRSDLGTMYTLQFNKCALDAHHLPTTKRWLLSGAFPVYRFDNYSTKPFAPKGSTLKSACLFDSNQKTDGV